MTPLIGNLGGAIGSQYVPSQDSLYFVEYSGNLSVLRHVSSGKPQYQVLGTGYDNPEDVYVTAAGSTAYIDESNGDLVSVNLKGNTNRSAAVVITSSLLLPQQMVIDEARHLAYVVEFNNPGSLVSVDLTVGTITTILSNLQNPIGVLLSPDGNSVYITGQIGSAGYLNRYSLLIPGGNQVVVASTANAALFFLSWANANHNAVLVTERDPSNKVWFFSLANPLAGLKLVANVAFRPSSVAFVSRVGSSLPILVCTDSDIEKLT